MGGRESCTADHRQRFKHTLPLGKNIFERTREFSVKKSCSAITRPVEMGPDRVTVLPPATCLQCVSRFLVSGSSSQQASHGPGLTGQDPLDAAANTVSPQEQPFRAKLARSTKILDGH